MFHPILRILGVHGYEGTAGLNNTEHGGDQSTVTFQDEHYPVLHPHTPYNQAVGNAVGHLVDFMVSELPILCYQGHFIPAFGDLFFK
ncbi:hypothetical protein DSECCO2_238650 [anaerobic digester metagenome]